MLLTPPGAAASQTADLLLAAPRLPSKVKVSPPTTGPPVQLPASLTLEVHAQARPGVGRRRDADA